VNGQIASWPDADGGTVDSRVTQGMVLARIDEALSTPTWPRPGRSLDPGRFPWRGELEPGRGRPDEGRA
jgi:hypothetical protein